MSTVLNRKSAAVMFTDIVGSTDIMAKDEVKALSLLKEKRLQEKTGVRVNAYYNDWLYYMIFKVNKFLQSAYNKLNNISNKLNEKDRKTFLNCAWPKLIIEEWGDNNEL